MAKMIIPLVKRKIALFVLSAIVTSLAIPVFFMLKRTDGFKDSSIAESPIVKVETVLRKDTVSTFENCGIITVKEKASISSMIGGTIEKIHTDTGRKVLKGMTLFNLNTSDLQLQLKTKNSDIQSADSTVKLYKAKLENAEQNVEKYIASLVKYSIEIKKKTLELSSEEKEYRRKKELEYIGGISSVELENAFVKISVMKGDLLQLRKEIDAMSIGYRDDDIIKAGFTLPENLNEKNRLLKIINTKLERAELESAVSTLNKYFAEREILIKTIGYASVKSPISGEVAGKNIFIGENVQPGTELLAIVNTDMVYLKTEVAENDLVKLRCGQKASIKIDAVGRTFSGIIDIINPLVDPSNHSAEIYFLIDNKENLLKPGMFATAITIVEEFKNVLVIPEKCVFEKNDETRKIKIFLAVNGKVFEKEVSANILSDDGYITDEVAENTQLAVYDNVYLKDDSVIKISGNNN